MATYNKESDFEERVDREQQTKPLSVWVAVLKSCILYKHVCKGVTLLVVSVVRYLVN